MHKIRENDQGEEHPTIYHETLTSLPEAPPSLLLTHPSLANLLAQLSTPVLFDEDNPHNPHHHIYESRHNHVAMKGELEKLREVTKEAMEVCCGEVERLKVENEMMECKIAFLNQRMEMARKELMGETTIGGNAGDTSNGSGREVWNTFCAMVSEGVPSGGSKQQQQQQLLQSVQERDEASTYSGLDGSSKNDNEGDDYDANNNDQYESFGEKGGSLAKSTSSSKGENTSMTGSTSRSSFLSLMKFNSHNRLGGQQQQQQQQQQQSSNDNNSDTASSSGGGTMRSSFLDGMGDGMPSRWKAREMERERSQRFVGVGASGSPGRKGNNNQNSFVDPTNEQYASSSDHPPQTQTQQQPHHQQPHVLTPRQKKLAQLQLLNHLIQLREYEINSLERKTNSAEIKTTHLKDEISQLEQTSIQSTSQTTATKNNLLKEIERIQSNNEKLDVLLLETNVILEEKMISVELLGDELREAREELYGAQQMKEKLMMKLKKKERRARRKSSSTDNNNNTTAVDNGGTNRDTNNNNQGNSNINNNMSMAQASMPNETNGSSLHEQQQHQQMFQQQQQIIQNYYQQQQQQGIGDEVQTFRVKTDGEKKGPPRSFRRNNYPTTTRRYQVPASVQEEYNQYMMQQQQQQYGGSGGVGRISESSTSDGESDDGGEGGKIVRRQSLQSVNTFTSMVSALTLDSGDMVDILDQFE